MEAARTSEKLVNFYQIARHYNPEDSHFLSMLCTASNLKNITNYHKLSVGTIVNQFEPPPMKLLVQVYGSGIHLKGSVQVQV
jgi:hypothetical protein